MSFKIELVTSRPVADRILQRASIEKIRVEKKLGSSIIKSYTTSQSLSAKLEDKAEWESNLAKAISDVATLPEGPAKERAKVNQQEFQWRLDKLALATEAEDPEDVVWAELDKSIAMSSLPKVEQLIAELTAHRDTLPE